MYEYILKLDPTFDISKGNQLNRIVKLLILQIERKNLFARGNPHVAISDHDMAQALQVKSFHSSQLEEYIKRKLFCAHSLREPIDNETWKVNVVKQKTVYRPEYRITPKEKLFHFKQSFFRLLRNAKLVESANNIFTYEEVCQIVSTYLRGRKYEIFDESNILICMLKGTDLEECFRMEAFGRSQVHIAMKNIIYPCSKRKNRKFLSLM